MAAFFPLPSLRKSFIDMLPQLQLQKPASSSENNLRKMPPDGENAAPPFLPLSFSSCDRPMDQSVSWIQLPLILDTPETYNAIELSLLVFLIVLPRTTKCLKVQVGKRTQAALPLY